MFKTILIPLDGSTRAETVLPVAARLAHHTNATLVLVRVVSIADEYWSAMPLPYPSMIQAAVESDLEAATAYLTRLTASNELADIPVKTVALFGSPAAAVLAVANSYSADLIVLCSHGSSGLAHWMMGGVAKKIVRHAPMPVLVLREGGIAITESVARLAQPLRILVPQDGSKGAKAALEPAVNLLTSLAAPSQKMAIHLARVIKPSMANADEAEERLLYHSELDHARQDLSQKAEWLREGYLAPVVARQHIPVTWSVVVDTDTASALLRVAEQGEDTEGSGVFGGCDLIAMTTHGRTGLQRWVMGSIVERMLVATKHPLLIVHPSETTTQEELSDVAPLHAISG